MIKKKQHFVSQFYLKNWADSNDRLFTFINNKVVPMKTKEVAHSNYFYKVDGVNEEERELLLKETKDLADPLKSAMDNLINGLHLIHKFPLQEDTDNTELNKLKINAVEDFYCIVEDLGSDSLKIVLSKEYKKIDLFHYADIVRFITYQLARTPIVKNKTKDSLGNTLDQTNVRFESYHILSSLILAEKISLSLIEQLYTLVVIDNKTGIDLITNDNPSRNLNPIEQRNAKLFIPLSPDQALLLQPSEFTEEEASIIKKTPHDKLSKSQYYLTVTDCSDDDYIKKLNEITWNNKERNAFSQKKEDLESLMETQEIS